MFFLTEIKKNKVTLFSVRWLHKVLIECYKSIKQMCKAKNMHKIYESIYKLFEAFL